MQCVIVEQNSSNLDGLVEVPHVNPLIFHDCGSFAMLFDCVFSLGTKGDHPQGYF